MISVPLNCIHGKIVTLISLEVLAGISAGAEMNLALFSTDQVELIVELVEVEAHTASETVDEGVFLVVRKLLVLFRDQLQLDDFLRLKLIFHEIPCCHSAVRRNGVEAKVFISIICRPADLPHGVGVLGSPHSGLVDGLIISLDSNIIDHDSTVVAADSEEGRILGVEVKAHYTRLSSELILWECRVLNGEAADEACVLLQEIIRTITDCE